MYDPDGHSYDMMRGGNGSDMMNDGWMVGFAVLALVLLLLALLAVLANLFFHVTRKPLAAAPTPGPEARLVLDGRLARGEVSAEEYQTVRALLDAG